MKTRLDRDAACQTKQKPAPKTDSEIPQSVNNNTILSAALFYALLGWEVLFCKPSSKEPYTPHGFKDATCDPGEIKHLVSKYPNANIGIATGGISGIFVLDIDPRNGGRAALKKLEAEHGPLPRTCVVRTGGGGEHYYFRHTGGEIRCRANFLPGIDIKADGGYVIAPPSIHPQDVAMNGFNGPPTPEPAPEWLLEKANKAQAHSSADLPEFHVDDAHVSEDTKELIRRGKPKGQRSESVFKAIRAMVTAGHADDEILAIMLNPEHVLSEKPLEKGRAWLEAEIRRARTKPLRSNSESTSTPAPPKGCENIISAPDLIAKELPPLQWVVPGLIPEGLSLLAGKPKMGKSWWALNLAVAVASDSNVFEDSGMRVNPGRVLYTALEDSERRLQDRLKVVLQGDEAPINLDLVTDWPPPRSRRNRKFAQLCRKARQRHPANNNRYPG